MRALGLEPKLEAPVANAIASVLPTAYLETLLIDLYAKLLSTSLSALTAAHGFYSFCNCYLQF